MSDIGFVRRIRILQQSDVQFAIATAAVSYTGPGDLGATALAWGGLRALTSSYASSLGSLFDLHNSSTGVFAGTVHATATGKLNMTEVNSLIGSASHIGKIYDQTGNARDWTQTTDAQRPILTLTASPDGTLPTMRFTAASIMFLAGSGTVSVSQYFVMGVVKPVSGGAGLRVFGGSNGDAGVYAAYQGGTGFVLSNGAGVVSLNVADGTWYNALLYPDGAGNGRIWANTTDSGTSAGIGSNGYTSDAMDYGASTSLGGLWDGDAQEIGLWTGNPTTLQSALNTNAHSSTNGWNF